MPLLKTLFLFFLCSFITCSLLGQSVKGSWYGVGHIQMDGNTENYLSELVLKQDGNLIKGEFNYYFRDSLFKNKITGSYNNKTRLIIIKQFPLIYYRSASTKQAVMVDVMGTFELRVAKTGALINGSLTSASERTLLMPVINYRLIKDTVATVKNNTTAKQNNQAALTKTKTPEKTADKKTTTATATATPKPNTNQTHTAITTSTIVHQDSVPKKINIKKVDPSFTKATTKIDTVSKQNTEVVAVVPIAKKTEEAFIARKKVYAKIIEVENTKLRLEVYDNGTIDYDSVSLLLNDKLVLPKTMLSHHSVKLNIELDENLEFNELGMFAENLGLIPPNTAALIIHDGKKTYEITLNSDFTKNAIIQLKTKKGNKKD